MLDSVLGIDPGYGRSAYCTVDVHTFRPLKFGILDNELFLTMLQETHALDCNIVAFEKIESYGIAVGRDVFYTCVWVGRLLQMVVQCNVPCIYYVPRMDAKIHICRSASATDANIHRALINRFATKDLKYGKGGRHDRDFFYGIKDHMWSAYAIGLTVAESIKTYDEDLKHKVIRWREW